MTTHKPYHGPNPPVAFRKPTIGARVYLVESVAGWPETYIRKNADEALAKFIAPNDVEDVLQTFRTAIQLEAREETWGDIIDFIGKITGQSPRMIPEIVGVGFWGQLIMFEHQQGTN
jgi:hypothetical protein